MHLLTTHFEDLLKNTKPPPHRLDAAKRLPQDVRDYLARHEEFSTVPPHSRLAGSYAQHTCVGNVKDVDFLVRVAGDPANNEPQAKQVVQSLRDALDDLPDALGYSGGSASMDIERARRSVHVYFEDEDFHVDAVPVIAPNGFNRVLYVPDHGFNTWIKSHPVGYTDLITKLNNRHNKKVRPAIKLLKHFRNVQMKTRRPKSYWLGSLVIYHVRRDDGLDTSQSLGALFHDLVDGIYKQYDHLLWTSDSATPNIEDPMLGHNISWNWTRSHFETFMRRLDEARQWSEAALAAEDPDEAICWWQKIFGEEYFPADVGATVNTLASMAVPGEGFVTASGLIMTKPGKAVEKTPIRQTTFHGKA